MTQCPSHLSGGCQTLDFFEVLGISCNFQQNAFSELGPRMESMIFVSLWTFHWISIINVLHELAPQPPPLAPSGGIVKYQLYVQF